MVRNRRFILKRIPVGIPVPGKDLVVEAENFDLKQNAPSGGIIVKNLYASLDPYQRACMSQPATIPFFQSTSVGQPISGLGLAKVLKSCTPKFEEGALISALLPIQEYSIINDEWVSFCVVIRNPNDHHLALFLGALGATGFTAYGSFYQVSKPSRGETILISSAAGAVGHIVGQLAKLEGIRVIGSVGSDEKLSYILDELHFDAGFNYKKERPLDALERITKGIPRKEIDTYFDNVGGEHLEAALEYLKPHGRVICCGMMSDYDKKPNERFGVRNLLNVIVKRIVMKGFLLTSYINVMGKDYQEMADEFSELLKNGDIITRSHMIHGIENVPQGFVGMLQGENIGKTILKIADYCTEDLFHQ
ncbi:hypothetical protein K3495_g5292 [Podosphaera aphanis]|nr:hypothetical protein K3495_g5292 [Podosphaera aphanis]